MEQIYIVLYNGAYEYEPEDITVKKAFKNYNDAKEYFNKRVNEIKFEDYAQCFNDNGNLIDDEYIVEEKADYFEIYKDGEYCMDHELIKIEKIELN